MVCNLLYKMREKKMFIEMSSKFNVSFFFIEACDLRSILITQLTDLNLKLQVFTVITGLLDEYFDIVFATSIRKLGSPH